MYGPTETTIWSTCYRITKSEKTILVGKPIANTRVYILDGQLQPVPIGVSGEMYIGGTGVSKGYLKQPDLTADQYLKDPFDNDPKARVYKTGDMARFRANGNIEILGRCDHQVKVNGHRIELGEIETVLMSVPTIQHAVAVAHTNKTGDKRLIVYYTTHDRQQPKMADLRGYLINKLPMYMVPSLFLMIDEIPRTPNGKIDRKALPIPDNKRPDLEQTYVPPVNDNERLLSDIWKNVLKLNQIGSYDRFFEIGGTSLLAVQIVLEIKKTFNMELSIVKLFQYSTIKSLANYLTERDDNTISFKKASIRAKLRAKRIAKSRAKPKEKAQITNPVSQ